MQHQELVDLAGRILSGNATLEETGLYIRWFDHFQNEEDHLIEDEELKKALLHARIRMNIRRNAGNKLAVSLKKTVGIAAVLILALGLSGYLYKYYKELDGRASALQAVINLEDVQPGRNKAKLFLDDGRGIDLSQATVDNLKSQLGPYIQGVDSGRLVYQETRSEQGATHYNRLVTPRGGRYQVILPDGTKAWLNAASSLRYPTAFNGSNRTVEVTGEVYFEVRHNATQPFIVIAKGAQVKVLGTHFDVNTYMDDCDIKTTLLEGSVNVSVRHISKKLVPGQQASIDQTTGKINIKKVDAAEVVSWTKGFLNLNTGDIRQFMNQLARWYNIEVVYMGVIPKSNMVGKINRSTPLTDVISVLNASGIRADFRKGRLIIGSQN